MLKTIFSVESHNDPINTALTAVLNNKQPNMGPAYKTNVIPVVFLRK